MLQGNLNQRLYSIFIFAACYLKLLSSVDFVVYGVHRSGRHMATQMEHIAAFESEHGFMGEIEAENSNFYDGLFIDKLARIFFGWLQAEMIQ